MSNTPVLRADLETSGQAPFLLTLCDDEHRIRDPEFLTQWLRVGEESRKKAIAGCLLTALFALAIPLFLFLLPFIILDTRRELRRIRDQRLLISEGRILSGEVVKCRAGWIPGVHEDSGHSYEVNIWYSFRTPEGLPLTSEAAADREDLQNAPLPKAGTPVQVLYLNRTNYRLL